MVAGMQKDSKVVVEAVANSWQVVLLQLHSISTPVPATLQLAGRGRRGL
jgi:hypothetical protein